MPILKALNGHGPKSSDFNKHWNRNKGLAYKGVEYNIGPTPDDVVLNLNNEQDYTVTPLWDVIGVVNGTTPHEVLIIGNHRDAWIAGGAGDPNSGSATLNEAIRAVGKALDAGWKPLRTIVFASWDGEEYGLVGSTEWVEEFLPWIKDANVAYLNVDVAVSGPNFSTGATPTLSHLVRDVASRVQSPNQTIEGQTVADLWDGKIEPLGSGSDFTAFQDYAGVPCINLGFEADPDGPVYHYHSNYDSINWMVEYGDPGFKYHRTMAQLIGLTIADLVDSIVMPFQAAEYADALKGYLDSVESKLNASEEEATTEEAIFALRAQVTAKEVTGSADAFRQSLAALRDSIVHFRIKALEIDERAAWANRELEAGIPWWNVIRHIKLVRTIIKVNKQYKYLERNLLFEGGLDGRSWFKHVVYAPGLWTGYSGGEYNIPRGNEREESLANNFAAVYPGLVESIDAQDYMNGLKWAGIIKTCIDKAAKSLE